MTEEKNETNCFGGVSNTLIDHNSSKDLTFWVFDL